MSDLRIMVVEDEALARRRMERLVGELAGATLAGSFPGGVEALRALGEEPVDVVLLDIQMPGLTGLELGRLLGEDGPRVIYTTAHPEHALEAFGIGAVDYLLKPVDTARLGQALERVRRSLPVGAEPTAPRGGPLPVPTRKGVRLLKTDLIEAAVWDGTASLLHLGAEKILVDLPLAELERRLPDPPFLRTHRRALVNLERVELLEDVDSGGYLAHMQGGAKVAVSRQVARGLRRRFGMG